MMSRIPTLLLSVVLCPLLSGCVAVAAAGVAGVAGIGLVQYQRNEAEQDFPSDLEQTWRASLEGLRRLGIENPTANLGSTEGVIEHEDLVLRVERHPEGFTRVRARVGTFHTSDHERRATLLLREIDRALEQEDELHDWTEKVEGLAEAEKNPDGSNKH